MLEAFEKVLRFAGGKTCEDLYHDEQFALAITKLIEIIVEAARHTGPEIQSRYPNIPWSNIARTRDRLIHGYFNVDYNIVWEIVTQEIDPLKKSLQIIDRDLSGSDYAPP